MGRCKPLGSLSSFLSYAPQLPGAKFCFLIVYILNFLLNTAVQSLRPVQLFATPWTAARQAPLSFTISRSLLQLMSIESVMPSNDSILSLLLLFLPSICPSIRVFSKKSALCIRWQKCWSFSFKNSPSNEYLGLICFRFDWFDLPAIHGTLKIILQYHNWNAALSLLYGPALTSLHDSCKNHSFDYTDLCRQSDVSAP